MIKYFGYTNYQMIFILWQRWIKPIVIKYTSIALHFLLLHYSILNLLLTFTLNLTITFPVKKTWLHLQKSKEKIFLDGFVGKDFLDWFVGKCEKTKKTNKSSTTRGNYLVARGNGCKRQMFVPLESTGRSVIKFWILF